MIISFLMVCLFFSCIEKKSAGDEKNKYERVNTSENDTLTFTSGIRAIFQDSKGHYWLGSHKEGVGHYDGTSFEYLTISEGLPDNQIRSILEDNHGHIWFESPRGVSRYDGKTMINLTSDTQETSGSEWKKTDNDLWFSAGTQQGVYRYDGQQLHFLAFPNPKDTYSGTVHAVTGLARGKNGKIWIATYAGVFGYDGQQLTVINDETLGLTAESEKIHVRSIFEDSQGRLWIGNNGIGVMMAEGDYIIHFSKKHGQLLPMNEFENNFHSKQWSHNHGLQAVFAIAEDSDQNIWFGDRDSGAWKFDGTSLTNYTIDKNLTSQMIMCIYKDQNNRLLFGMAEGGVYMFNGKSFDKIF
jgi:ligand-binding sensor domain-containing protein